MVKRDASLQHPCEAIADEIFLPGAQLEGIGIRQVACDLGGKRFGGAAARRKNQNRPKPLRQRLGGEPWPVAANLRRDVVVEHPGVHLLKRHRPVVVPNPFGVPAQTLKPSDNVLGIGHAAAEHQDLRFWRRHGDGQLVVETAIGVAEHLVLVDHQ